MTLTGWIPLAGSYCRSVIDAHPFAASGAPDPSPAASTWLSRRQRSGLAGKVVAQGFAGVSLITHYPADLSSKVSCISLH